MTARLPSFAHVLLLALSALWASGDTPEAPLADANHETERQTIATSQADYASQDPEVRRRAILILGKYAVPSAQGTVIQALDDPDAAVRRAAVVSIGERLPPPPQAVNPLLCRLGDADVHVRRIVSSMLPRIITRRRPILIRQDGKLVKVAPPAYPSAVVQAITKAFADGDATVRQNMLSIHQLVADVVGHEVLTPLLQDADRDNRMLAVQACHQALGPDAFAEAVLPLATDPDRLIRLFLASSLASRPVPAAVPILNRLAQADDPEIAAEAYCGLLKLTQPVDPARLQALLAAPALPSASAARLIGLLGRQSEEIFGPMLLSLTEHTSSEVRAAAIRASAAVSAQDADPAQYLPMLEDSSRAVRQAAGNVLLGTRLSAEQFRLLLQNPNADVRGLAVSLSRTAPADLAGEILEELLLDEDDAIRARVLPEIARRRGDGWLEILTVSLQDDDRDVRLAAVRALGAAPDPAARTALATFAHATRDPELLRLIQAYLRRKPGRAR